MPRGRPAKTQRPAEVSVKEPAAKKAKKAADPVMEKVAVVCQALTNKNYEIAGPASCRSMLCSMAPAALSTSQDERHDYQEALFGMIDDIFQSAQVSFERRISEATAVLDNAQNEQAAREAAKAAAVEVVMAKKSEVTEKQQVVVQDASSIRDAEKKLREAKENHSSSEAEWQALGVDQEKCQEVIQGTFQVLKDGSWENPRAQKQKLAALKSYVQKNLSQDKSVLDSMSTVFSKKPEERGSFDNMVVDQLANSLAQHLEALGEKRNTAAAQITEKAAMVEQAGESVKTAQEKQQESKAAVAKAEAEHVHLTAELADAQKAVKEHANTTRQAVTDLECHTAIQDRLTEDREAFAFLRARKVVPGENAEKTAEVSEMLVQENAGKAEVTMPEISKAPVQASPAAVTMIAAGA